MVSCQNLTPGVYIVGAGPGDPELLTVKAVNLLRSGEVILFADSLIPTTILQFCDPEAEIIKTADQTLEEMISLMIDRVTRGRSVIRLHSGDPCLYGAIHEQMYRLAEANIPFEIVPGISAFQLAAARLKVELTVPELVQTIILTRVSGRTFVPAAEELGTLAAHQATLCLYLSAGHVLKAQESLLLHYPKDTLVAICYRLGWFDEKIWLVDLDQMSSMTKQNNLERTTLYVISPALRGAKSRSCLYNPEHFHLFRQDS